MRRRAVGIGAMLVAGLFALSLVAEPDIHGARIPAAQQAAAGIMPLAGVHDPACPMRWQLAHRMLAPEIAAIACAPPPALASR